MTQQELWSAYCARNPSFDSSGEVTMTASGLKKLFDQTWQLAFEAGSKSTWPKSSPKDIPPNPFDQFFNKR